LRAGTKKSTAAITSLVRIVFRAAPAERIDERVKRSADTGKLFDF
jgi:hypothetical protein